ncbi:hypothetical protein FACS1894187_20960 [Synergistales bacterium]|nr:hypothetical protein FACS1894187_20960 [Synergistales bacterium]
MPERPIILFGQTTDAKRTKKNSGFSHVHLPYDIDHFEWRGVQE